MTLDDNIEPESKFVCIHYLKDHFCFSAAKIIIICVFYVRNSEYFSFISRILFNNVMQLLLQKSLIWKA